MDNMHASDVWCQAVCTDRHSSSDEPANQRNAKGKTKKQNEEMLLRTRSLWRDHAFRTL